MQGIIRIGDKTTGGGAVLSSSSHMIFEDLRVARVGDPVSCLIPGHGPTVIAEGHPHVKEDDVPIAFNGHLCACGCVLLSSLPNAVAS